MNRSPATCKFSLLPAETLSNFLNPSMLKKALFELVQQFYHATEIGNVATAVSTSVDQP